MALIAALHRQFASANLGQTWNIQPRTGRKEDQILTSCVLNEIIKIIKSKIYFHPFIILNFESYIKWKCSQNWVLVSACPGLNISCLSEVCRCKLTMHKIVFKTNLGECSRYCNKSLQTHPNHAAWLGNANCKMDRRFLVNLIYDSAANHDSDEEGVVKLQRRRRSSLPDGYSQIFRSYVFGPLGFWTMAPLRCAAKFDPFLSLDWAPTPSTLAQSRVRKGSNFAIWQPWAIAEQFWPYPNPWHVGCSLASANEEIITPFVKRRRLVARPSRNPRASVRVRRTKG